MPEPKVSFASQAMSVAWLATIAGTVIYLIFFRGSSQRESAAIPDYPPGWLRLAECSDTMSLDEKKSLHLSEDGKASLEDRSQAKDDGGGGNIRFVEGEWRYDAASHRYALTLDGETAIYGLVSGGEPTTCVLFNGDIGAADLRASWFSFPSDEDMRDYNYGPDR
jgi:hypothetical protein